MLKYIVESVPGKAMMEREIRRKAGQDWEWGRVKRHLTEEGEEKQSEDMHKGIRKAVEYNQ